MGTNPATRNCCNVVKDEGPKKENSVEIEPTRRGLGKLRDPSSQSQICDRRLRAITMVSLASGPSGSHLRRTVALASMTETIVQAGDGNFDRLVLGSGKNGSSFSRPGRAAASR